MISLKNVSFAYQGLEQAGIRTINLTIRDGECLLLCGASGCGKTTITRLINGLIPHFYKGTLEGEVSVNGRTIRETELYELAGVVGTVFQNPRSQFFSVDTDGEIVFGPENLGLDAEEILARKRAVVRNLNVETLLKRSLFELSGGEKQRIACASVAALLPEIIILDEPSSNLDWHSIEQLREVIGLWKAQGKTILISEHRLWYLRDLIDRAVYLEAGTVCREWDGEEFRRLSSAELLKMQLRPIWLEDALAAQFGPRTENGKCPVQEEADLVLEEFYFAYHLPKHLFVRHRLTRADEEICQVRIPKLTAKCGDIIAVIGNNGSGKSTFLRCLCGLEANCIGRVSFRGKTFYGKQLQRISYMVMQDVNHQLFTTSVLDEVLLSMPVEERQGVEEILTRLDLKDKADQHPMALSGGQKQRVAIASAIAAEAEILLFDEPTSGLDYGHMREVALLLQRLSAAGKIVFVSTHDPELIAMCCNRTIRISDGRAVELTDSTSP